MKFNEICCWRTLYVPRELLIIDVGELAHATRDFPHINLRASYPDIFALVSFDEALDGSESENFSLHSSYSKL